MTQSQSVSTFESEVRNSLSMLERHSMDSLGHQHRAKKLSPKFSLYFKVLCESKETLLLFNNDSTHYSRPLIIATKTRNPTFENPVHHNHEPFSILHYFHPFFEFTVHVQSIFFAMRHDFLQTVCNLFILLVSC